MEDRAVYERVISYLMKMASIVQTVSKQKREISAILDSVINFPLSLTSSNSVEYYEIGKVFVPERRDPLNLLLNRDMKSNEMRELTVIVSDGIEFVFNRSYCVARIRNGKMRCGDLIYLAALHRLNPRMFDEIIKKLEETSEAVQQALETLKAIVAVVNLTLK